MIRVSQSVLKAMNELKPINSLFADSEFQIFGCDERYDGEMGSDLLGFGFPGPAKEYHLGFKFDSFQVESVYPGVAKWFRLEGRDKGSWISGSIGDREGDMRVSTPIFTGSNGFAVDFFTVESPFYRPMELGGPVTSKHKKTWFEKLLNKIGLQYIR